MAHYKLVDIVTRPNLDNIFTAPKRIFFQKKNAFEKILFCTAAVKMVISIGQTFSS